MKNLMLVLMAVTLPFFIQPAFSQEPGQAVPGISMETFSKIFPTVIPSNAKDDGQFQREEKINDLPGTWTYEFKARQLSWFTWSAYVNEINSENFSKCLTVAQQLIGRYKKLYGAPVKTENGTLSFRDPVTDHHWGYKVTDAWWVTAEMKIHIGFNFFGGKGEYHFIVEMEFEKP